MADCFYVPLGDGRYESTEHTNGPWTEGHQHLGPPSALLAREIENCSPRTDTQLARITVEILGPVPVAPLQVRATVERPGRSVELLSAELLDDTRPVARALAWRIATSDTTEVSAGLADPLPAPGENAVLAGRPDGWHGGYLDAMEWTFLHGGLDRQGAATVWVRQRVALVDGEEPSGVQRVLAVADSGNGVSNRLDIRKWLFINSELTVHLLREPAGEWVGLDATTLIGPNGVGTATSVLHDRSGQVGRGAQALLIRPR